MSKIVDFPALVLDKVYTGFDVDFKDKLDGIIEVTIISLEQRWDGTWSYIATAEDNSVYRFSLKDFGTKIFVNSEEATISQWLIPF